MPWQRTGTSGFVITLVIILLSACKSTAPIQTQPTIPSVSIGPSLNSPINESPTPAHPFAIYLLAPQISAQDLAILSHLELQSQPLLTIDDIVIYDHFTHEIELTATGFEKISRLDFPVSGIPFAVCVNNMPIYAGAFWPSYSSLSFDGVVIDPILITKERPFIQIQLGYPGADFFRGEDPRADVRILQALENAGKLK